METRDKLFTEEQYLKQLKMYDEVTLDLNSLEGTWILVNSKGWEFCSEEVTKDEWEKIVVSANELTVHSVEKNCNNIVFVAIRRVI